MDLEELVWKSPEYLALLDEARKTPGNNEWVFDTGPIDEEHSYQVKITRTNNVIKQKLIKKTKRTVFRPPGYVPRFVSDPNNIVNPTLISISEPIQMKVNQQNEYKDWLSWMSWDNPEYVNLIIDRYKSIYYPELLKQKEKKKFKAIGLDSTKFKLPTTTTFQASTIDDSIGIVIENISLDFDYNELNEILSEAGVIMKLKVLKPRKNESTTKAYVTYMKLKQAEDAVTKFNKYPYLSLMWSVYIKNDNTSIRTLLKGHDLEDTEINDIINYARDNTYAPNTTARQELIEYLNKKPRCTIDEAKQIVNFIHKRAKYCY